jgi:peptide/nickel transport system substrate-binding protein
MIAGSEDLDLSLPPEDQAPTAGFTTPAYVKPTGEPWTVTPGSLTLVRNPSWDPATDGLRAAVADRIEVQLRGAHALPPDLQASTVEELVAAVEDGTVDHVPDLPYTQRQIRGYLADPSMEGCVTSAPTGTIFYIFLNLAVPPFDDLHVRRAVAFAIDETAILRAMEPGLHVERRGSVATHLAPDSSEGDLLEGFDPYPTSLERAREEMALSRYDADGDGLCDAPACEDVLALTREEALGPAASGQVAASLRRIGIDLSVETLTAGLFYPRVADERGKVPISMGFGWIWAYPNASTVLPDLFASSNIPGGGYNSSLLGATPSQLRRWGYDVTEVPSADDRIERCTAMTGSAQTECWAELDRYLMEDVVPAIPYLAPESTFVVSQRVASYSLSMTTTYLAFDRMALVSGSE